MNHTCHAIKCQIAVAPRFLMCPRHWRMVPQGARRGIASTYIPGQERTKTPTLAYLREQRRAVMHVALQEGHVGLEIAVAEVARYDGPILRLMHAIVLREIESNPTATAGELGTMINADPEVAAKVDHIRQELRSSIRGGYGD